MNEHEFQGLPTKSVRVAHGSAEVIANEVGGTIAIYLRNIDNVPMSQRDVVELHADLSDVIMNFVRMDLATFYKTRYRMNDWAVHLHKICKPTNLKEFCSWLDTLIY